MATFVHITDERQVRHIRRAGIRTSEHRWASVNNAPWRRVVFCVPIIPSYQATFQWLRELKRGGYRTACAVQFRIADAEWVWIGRYAKPKELVTAAQAVALYAGAADPRGLEVLVPRGIAPREILRVRTLRQVTGWRFYPEAKGQEPFPYSGEIKAARVRRAMEERYRSPLEDLVDD